MPVCPSVWLQVGVRWASSVQIETECSLAAARSLERMCGGGGLTARQGAELVDEDRAVQQLRAAGLIDWHPSLPSSLKLTDVGQRQVLLMEKLVGVSMRSCSAPIYHCTTERIPI